MILSKSDITLEMEPEYVSIVSRGNIDYPTEYLFDLSLYLYSYYQSKDDKLYE